MLKRIIFLTLLTLNLVLFVWGYQRPPPEQPSIPTLALEGPSIKLLSEHGIQAPPNYIFSNDKNIAQNCIRIGPIDQQMIAVDFIARLEQAGHKTTLETETNKQNSGFWVVIGVKNKKSGKLMAELNAAGILDVWRFEKGPLSGMFSLGLYSDHAGAEERLKNLKRKGFNANIQPRTLDVTTYWISSSYLAKNIHSQQILEKIYKDHPTLIFPPPACP